MFTIKRYGSLWRIDKDGFFHMRFVAKTQSICVYGEDIRSEIQPFRLSPEIVNFDISYLPVAIQKVRNLITESFLSSGEIKTECHHLMKKFVRTGLALYALEDQVYTRDLGYCYDVFVKHVPEKRKDMAQAVEWVIQPIGEREILLDYLDDFGSWIETKCKDWLFIYNPTNDFEMKHL